MTTMLLALRGLFIIATCRLTIATPTPIRTYDQRQTGDLNVQIALKDLRVVALYDSENLDDYTEYDYFYDYADFTIKPINRPTTSTTTTEKSDITGVSEPLSSPNSTISTISSGNINSTELNTTLSNDEEILNADPIMEKNNITDASESLSSLNSTISTSSDNINSTERNTTVPNDEEIPNANSSNGIVNLTLNSNNDKSQSSEKKSETIVASLTRKSAVRSQKRCKSGYVPNGDGRCRRASRPWMSLLP